MCPVPCIVGAVVRVEHVVARILQIFCGAFALFHIAADFDKVFTGHCADAEVFGLADDGITERYGIILAAFGFDCFDDFDGETVSVFKTSAVFVRSVVGVFVCELVKQITFVHGVNFHTVYARFLAELCSLCESVNHLLDFLLGEGAAFYVLRPTGRQFARRRADCGYIHDGFRKRGKHFVVVKHSKVVGDCKRTTEARDGGQS